MYAVSFADGVFVQIDTSAAVNMALFLVMVLLLQVFCFDVAAKPLGCRNPIVRKEW
jgi:hypothetical protein